MIKLVALALTAGLLAIGASGAHAQALGVKCGILSGTPFMCVKNASNYAVTSVQATAGWAGSSWVPMPGGTLRPGETTIVKFPGTWSGGGCNQNVYVRDERGVSHPFYHLDVCHFAGLVVH